MRANRAPRDGANHPLRRLPVSTIRELDENSEENVELTAEGDYLLKTAGDVLDSGRPSAEASGLLDLRRQSDTPEPLSINGASTNPAKEQQGRSFERLIISLMVRAQIKIYLPDYTAFDFNPVTGYDCRSPEVIEAMIKAKNLDPSQARRTFAVWFVNETDALEVQLKPQHNPFVIQKYWRYFLRRYAPLDSAGDGIPVVFVRRSLWLSLEAERRLTDPRVLLHLFEEARSVFLRSHYHLSRSDVISLGSLLIFKEHGRYSINTQHITSVRKKLRNYFPNGIIPERRKLFRKVHPEDVINEILTVYQSTSARNNDEVRLRFLEVCRDNPLYGAVFFPGVIESRPKSRISGMLTGFSDVPITVAVNERGFFVLSDLKKDSFPVNLLLALSHTEIMVAFKEPSERDAVFDFDTACLRVTIRVPVQGTHHSAGVPRTLWIFSKQAPLIAACLSTFIHNQRAVDFRRRDNLIDGVEDADHIAAVAEAAGSRSETPTTETWSHKVAVKSAKSTAFPDVTNRFDAFVLHSVTEA